MRSWFFLVASACLAAAGASAADNLPETAQAPYDAMRELEGLKGAWTVSTEYVDQNGERSMLSKDVVVAEESLRGLMLTEKHKERLEGQGFMLETDYSYDQYRNVYRLAATDDTWGVMDIYEGRVENGVLQATNLRSGTYFPTADGGKMHVRLTIPTKGDRRVMEVDHSLDEGESWRPLYRVTYERRRTE